MMNKCGLRSKVVLGSIAIGLTVGITIGISIISYAGNDTPAVEADNSGMNARDVKSTDVTADQQSSNSRDFAISRRIRQSIVKDKDLSVNAHNVKIITQGGVVTLKGPVKSEAEKAKIESLATSIAGANNVKTEIQIAAH